MANMGGVTMWGNRLKILIFTRRAGFRESLQGVSAGESCLIEFLPEQKAVSEQACAEADIVLLDLGLEEIPLSVRSYCKSAATQLVLLDPSGLGAELDESGLLAVLDGIWQPPFTEKRLAFYFQQTVRRACAQQKLWRMEHLLDALIDSVPDLIWFKDTRGAHLKVNDGFCQMVHKTKQQCEGRSHYYIWDIDPEEYQKGEFVCMESEEQVMQEKKTCVFDEKIKGLDGHMMQFRTYKSPIFDFDGTLLGTMGVAHDVTDWKNKSAELNVMLNTLREPAMVIALPAISSRSISASASSFRRKRPNFWGFLMLSGKRRPCTAVSGCSREKKCALRISLLGESLSWNLWKSLFLMCSIKNLDTFVFSGISLSMRIIVSCRRTTSGSWKQMSG